MLLHLDPNYIKVSRSQHEKCSLFSDGRTLGSNIFLVLCRILCAKAVVGATSSECFLDDAVDALVLSHPTASQH